MTDNSSLDLKVIFFNDLDNIVCRVTGLMGLDSWQSESRFPRHTETEIEVFKSLGYERAFSKEHMEEIAVETFFRSYHLNNGIHHA